MILFLFLFNAQVNKNLSFLVPIDYSYCRNRNPAEKWVFGFYRDEIILSPQILLL